MSISWICGSDSDSRCPRRRSKRHPAMGDRKQEERQNGHFAEPAGLPTLETADRRDAAGRENRHGMTEGDEGPRAGKDQGQCEQSGETGIHRRDQPGLAQDPVARFLDRPAASAATQADPVLADLEAAKIERRQDSDSRHEDHQTAGPADQRPPEMKRVRQEAWPVEERRSGRRQAGQHLEIGPAEARGRVSGRPAAPREQPAEADRREASVMRW